MLLCKFCVKECKSNNSLRNHERLCKLNPNRQQSCFEDPEFRKIKKKSNGSIKAKEEGRKFTMSDATRKKLSDANNARTPEFHIENAKKISKTVNEKVKDGTWHTSLAKHMHYNYNGVDLHGSWELEYAKYLDLNNIRWIRNKDSFSYIFKDKERKYTPDFYLVEKDLYIEIKGYKTEKDSAKWSQFPSHRTLKVLMKDDLLQLGLNIKT